MGAVDSIHILPRFTTANPEDFDSSFEGSDFKAPLAVSDGDHAFPQHIEHLCRDLDMGCLFLDYMPK